MPKVEVIQHEWVAITLEQVTVLKDSKNDSVTIFSDPDTPPETQYGCNRCGAYLEKDGANLHSNCDEEGGD